MHIEGLRARMGINSWPLIGHKLWKVRDETMVKDLSEFKARVKASGLGRETLAAEVARATDQPKTRVRAIVDQIFLTMQEALESGKLVEIRGFGTFRAHRRNSRRSHVPSLKKLVRVDARWVVNFKTSKLLKLSLMETLEG